ncbi:MAG: sugar ABC transporter permease, partial [Hyphomicrobium sp.]|nr:sugar ABC transporter permease [Hyphomicrobium sp.]
MGVFLAGSFYSDFAFLTGSMTTNTLPLPRPFWDRLSEPSWDNWPLALIAFLIGLLVAIPTLPPAVSFWIGVGLAALLAVTVVVNAWGRYTGGLLVAPAIALLFVMNIFPLLWSFGLSFFAYRANRMKPPEFIGLDNYAKVVTDPVVWER